MTGAERQWDAAGREPAPADAPRAMLRPAGEVAASPYERVDTLIRRLFKVGMNLHTALGHIRERVEVDAAGRLIDEAIAVLDEAIKECRGVAVDLLPSGPAAPDTGAARARERPDGPGRPRPVGGGRGTGPLRRGEGGLSGGAGPPEPGPPSRRPEDGPPAGPAPW